MSSWCVYYEEILGSDAVISIDGRRTIMGALAEAKAHAARSARLRGVTYCIIGKGRIGQGTKFQIKGAFK